MYTRGREFEGVGSDFYWESSRSSWCAHQKAHFVSLLKKFSPCAQIKKIKIENHEQRNIETN